MKQRLERSGIRSISAVVDVTNYVMLELGQPLHAYDDRLLDGAIVVRFARAGETLTLLNEQKLDCSSPTSCSSPTRRSRWALPASWAASIPASATRRPPCCSKARSGIRPSSRAGRDASASRATQAIGSSAASTSAAARAPSSARRSSSSNAAAASAGPLSDVKGALPSRAAVRVRPARVTRLLGIALPAPTIAALFGRLGFSFARDGDDFLVTPPSYRFDLAIEEDFVEEIARLHGFDAIPVAVSAQRQAMLPAPEAARPVDGRQAPARGARLAGGRSPSIS